MYRKVWQMVNLRKFKGLDYELQDRCFLVDGFINHPSFRHRGAHFIVNLTGFLRKRINGYWNCHKQYIVLLFCPSSMVEDSLMVEIFVCFIFGDFSCRKLSFQNTFPLVFAWRMAFFDFLYESFSKISSNYCYSAFQGSSAIAFYVNGKWNNFHINGMTWSLSLLQHLQVETTLSFYLSKPKQYWHFSNCHPCLIIPLFAFPIRASCLLAQA